MTSPDERKLWACDSCGTTFVSTSRSSAGLHVSWEKFGGGFRRTTIHIETEGSCPGCGAENPDVTPIRPQR